MSWRRFFAEIPPTATAKLTKFSRVPDFAGNVSQRKPALDKKLDGTSNDRDRK
jgi:hypothetical protein